MTETAQKTGEELLLDSVNTQGSGNDDNGAGDGGEELSPEQKIISDLKKKAEDATARANLLERERDSERAQKNTARREASAAVDQSAAAREEAIKNAKIAAQTRFDAAQAAWDDAHDSGDKVKLREATLALNESQNMLRGAEYQESQFNTWKENAKTAAADLHDLKTGAGDTLRVPKSAIDWADKHPKLATDPDYADAVYDADGRAKRKGIVVYSKEYYEFLDSHLKRMSLLDSEEQVRQANSDSDPEPKKDTVTKKADKSSTATPVGGSSGSPSTESRKQTITMTPEMREAARFTFPDLKPDEAEKKYASIQIDIQKKKAKGEL